MVIEERAFERDTALTDVEFTGAHWMSDNEVRILANLHNEGSGITALNSWPYIGANAFYGCTGLRFITVIRTESNTTTTLSTDFQGPLSIGANAFNGCSSLVWEAPTTVGNTLVGIGNSAFSRCTSLSLPRLPATLQVLNQNAFSGCGTVKFDTIPRSITTMGKDIFNGTILHNNANGSINWEVSYATRDNGQGIVESDININNQCLNGLTMDHESAHIYLKLDKTDPRYADFSSSLTNLDPWKTAKYGLYDESTGTYDIRYKGFGAKTTAAGSPAPEVSVE